MSTSGSPTVAMVVLVSLPIRKTTGTVPVSPIWEGGVLVVESESERVLSFFHLGL